MKPSTYNREAGVALISVLAILTTVGMLVAVAVMLSQFASAEVSTLVELKRSHYTVESAVNRAVALLQQDRLLNPNRMLGTADYAQSDRFMADGIRHRLDIYGAAVQIQILDAGSGWDISGNSPARQLASFSDRADVNEQFSGLTDRLMDYVDRDDLVRGNGLEAAGYRSINLPVLPRNQPMQFKEELLWIPGSREFFQPGETGRLDLIRPIAPAKLKNISGRPNLYSVPPRLIAVTCRLTVEEELLLANALEEWQEQRRPLADTLPPAVYGKLAGRFANRESGVYTIIAVGAAEDSAGVQLAATLALGSGPLRLEYYEFFYY